MQQAGIFSVYATADVQRRTLVSCYWTSRSEFCLEKRAKPMLYTALQCTALYGKPSL